ncbi:hypothetical protein Tco_0434815 [Tanacetum coccineum]
MQQIKDESNSSGNECSYLGNVNNNSRNDTDGDGADIRPTYDSNSLKKVHSNDEYNVIANESQDTEQTEFINDIHVVEKVDSNTTPNLSNISNNEGEIDQDDVQEEERALLALLITDMNREINESKEINKELRQANMSFSYELKKYKDTEYVKEAECECAKAYGLLEELKVKSAKCNTPKICGSETITVGVTS